MGVDDLVEGRVRPHVDETVVVQNATGVWKDEMSSYCYRIPKVFGTIALRMHSPPMISTEIGEIFNTFRIVQAMMRCKKVAPREIYAIVCMGLR